MNSRLAICLLYCLGSAVFDLRGAEDNGQPPPIGDVVRDGDGEIWGIDPRSAGPLYRLDGDHWREVPVNGLADRKCRALALTRRADGAVVCLWGNQERERFFSVQRGKQARPPDPIALAHPDPGPGVSWLLADSKNNVWLTNSSPYICRLAPDGTAACVRVMKIEEGYLPGQTPGSANPPVEGWDQIVSCEDAQGRVWFHSQGFYSRHLLLRGLLVYDGETFTLRDPLPPENRERHVGALLPRDAGHLWLGVVYDGLYVLDTATFRLERVPDQPAEARGTQEIFRRGENDWILVLHGFGTRALHSLWSLRGNHWEKLAESIDADTLTGSGMTRVWVRTEGGYFLGTQSNGLWFVPDEGSPRIVNWQAGFPVTNPSRLLPLAGNGQWLCVDNNAHLWTGPLGEILARSAAAGNARLHYVRTSYPLVPDRRRHLWGFRVSDVGRLSEWDGAQWITHDLPADGSAGTWYRRPLGVDGAQRIWFSDVAPDRKTILIYDPAPDHWQKFAGWEDALQAQLALGPAAELAVSENPDDLARFGPRGQICYLDGRTTVGWYDGAVWRHWKRNEVHGPEDRYRFDGPPFFNDAGTLAVNIHQETWEYAGDNQWKRAATYRPGYADRDEKSSSARRIDPPPGAVNRRPQSVVFDNQGLCWLTWEQQLYRCRDGLCPAVFAPGEVQPFVDGRRLSSAFIDARGNAFLYSAERHEYVILAPPGPPPRTSLEIVATAGADALPADARTIRLTSDAVPIEGKVRFDWRLDDGAWQALAVEKSPATIDLDALRGGKHHVEARSFDAALQTEATPAGLDFEVGADSTAQIAGYIAELADPDHARRKAAVFALSRRPDLARPALQAARAKASNDDERWWIDATLQTISLAKPGANLPPMESSADSKK